MKIATLRIAIGLAMGTAGLCSSAHAGDCVGGRVEHFRPPVVYVGQPTAMESNSTTNVAVTAPEHNKVPSPLVPQAPRIIEIPMVEAAVELEVKVNFAETAVGSVILRSGDFEQELTVTQWDAKTIRFILPTIGVLKEHYVSLHIYRPDGYLVRQFPAKFIRSSSIRVVNRTSDTMEVRMLPTAVPAE